ncbi:MAG: formyl transferase [Candidatus Brockarchaeota archaeon]|nr:formyl transferase [Candidatus Brockarchaeota archaeon]
MIPRPIFDPREFGKMRLVCMMSGSGTNVAKIVEYQRKLEEELGRSPFEVVAIFTDNKQSNAKALAERYSLPCVCRDIMEFYRERGHETKKDLSIRPEYDGATVDFLEKYQPHAVALCGYMSIVTRPILDRFGDRIFNVHPADLSLRDAAGRRRFVGTNAVRDAILAGAKQLYSSTHIVREEVDHGEILMRSRPVEVVLPFGMDLQALSRAENRPVLEEVVRVHQERLKEQGDWVIYPLTLRMVSEGRYALDRDGNVYVDGQLMPFGYRL